MVYHFRYDDSFHYKHRQKMAKHIMNKYIYIRSLSPHNTIRIYYLRILSVYQSMKNLSMF